MNINVGLMCKASGDISPALNLMEHVEAFTRLLFVESIIEYVLHVNLTIL